VRRDTVDGGSWLGNDRTNLRATRSAVTLAEGERADRDRAQGIIGKDLGSGRSGAQAWYPRQTLESKIKALNIDTASFRAR
jgi:hypothetical protein